MYNTSYLRQIANDIRDKFDDNELPQVGLDDLFDMYAVLALAKGNYVTNEDVHNAWSAWAHKYEPNNDFIVPFWELPSDVQQEDTKFAEAIRNVAQVIDSARALQLS